MKEFLLLPAVGGIFIFMYEMLKKFDAFCDANRQNLWLEEDAVPEEKEESAEQVMTAFPLLFPQNGTAAWKNCSLHFREKRKYRTSVICLLVF